MKKQWMQIQVVLVLVVWVTGCATMSDVVRSKEEGKGTSKVYPIDADQAWEIAKTVFRWEGTDAIEEHRTEGYMLTSTGPDYVTTSGAVMGAWVEPVDKNSTRVTVVTKRRVATNIFTSLTETTFHERFAQAVETIKRGDRLPSKPPTSETQAIPPEKPVTSTPSISTTPPSAATIVAVTWTFANVRLGAGNDYPVVATVKKGDKLTVIGELGDWLNVRLGDGKEGWISNKVVK